LKVLVVRNRDMGGCVLYRQHAPHMNLAKNFEDVHVTFTSGLENFEAFFPGDKISNYDIVQYHKGWHSPNGVDIAKRAGCTTVVDFDDYWDVPYGHYLYSHYREQQVPKMYESQLKAFDHVTVTTPYLAEAVRPFNKNVHVLPNAIDPADPQFRIKPVKSDILRFGWIGGVCHLPDIELMRGLNNRLSNSELKGRYKLNLFGYHQNSIFDNYCDVLTEKGKWMDGLQLFPNQTAEAYTLYYNFLNAALIPLVDNRFNNLKSELKLIEAGFFKKAVIVSDVLPYSPLLKDGENCLKVRKSKDWFRHMKFLVNNPTEVTRLGNNLYETIKDKYNQNNVSQDRYNLYKCLTTIRSKQPAVA